jgi:hypothetical protein
MQEAADSNFTELICRVHLIWMPDPQGEPLVRILLVSTEGIQAVYEGLKSWTDCWSWISVLLDDHEPRSAPQREFDARLIRRLLEREGLATLPALAVPTCELALQGFHRA